MKYQVTEYTTLYVDDQKGTTLVIECEEKIVIFQVAPDGKISDEFHFDVDKKDILFETLDLNYGFGQDAKA